MDIEYKMKGKLINGKFIIPLKKSEYRVDEVDDIYLITVINLADNN